MKSYYATVEVRLTVQAEDEVKAMAQLGLAMAGVGIDITDQSDDGFMDTVEVKGHTLVAITEEN